MVRTDGIGKFSPSLNDQKYSSTLVKKIKDFFEKGYVVFVMHPGNIYKNKHSLNIMRLSGEVIIEIVGPGFIATDLNRYGFVHKRIKLKFPELYALDTEVLTNWSRYQKDKKEIIKRLGKNNIVKHNGYLLRYETYPPLSKEKIEMLIRCIPKIQKAANMLEINSTKWIASMSFVNLTEIKNEPLFWDLYSYI